MKKEEEKNEEEITKILDRITKLDKERKVLEGELKVVFAINEGDKVAIKNIKDGTLLRYAFLTRIKINPRGVDRLAHIEFELQKCKKNGTISNNADSLNIREHIQKTNQGNLYIKPTPQKVYVTIQEFQANGGYLKPEREIFFKEDNDFKIAGCYLEDKKGVLVGKNASTSFPISPSSFYVKIQTKPIYK